MGMVSLSWGPCWPVAQPIPSLFGTSLSGFNPTWSTVVSRNGNEGTNLGWNWSWETLDQTTWTIDDMTYVVNLINEHARDSKRHSYMWLANSILLLSINLVLLFCKNFAMRSRSKLRLVKSRHLIRWYQSMVSMSAPFLKIHPNNLCTNLNIPLKNNFCNWKKWSITCIFNHRPSQKVYHQRC